MATRGQRRWCLGLVRRRWKGPIVSAIADADGATMTAWSETDFDRTTCAAIPDLRTKCIFSRYDERNLALTGRRGTPSYIGMVRPAMTCRYSGGARIRSSGLKAAALAALISMPRLPTPLSAMAETCSVVRRIAFGGRAMPRSSDRIASGVLTKPG